jgi:choline kinase
MKAIILVAGEGKRLHPLTKNIPKCMVDLFGMSLLERQIKIFKKCNIDDIIIVGGYLNESIQIPGIKKYQNDDYDSTNMLESLFCAKNEFDDSIIISYGDIIFEKKVLQSLLDSKNDYSIIIDKQWKELWLSRMENPIDDAESLKIDSNGFITDIGQKVNNVDEIEGQYIGLMKFHEQGLQFIQNFYEKIKNEFKITGKNPINPEISFEKSYLTDFIRGLINEGCKMKAVPIDNGWLELDTFNDFQIYNKMYENGSLNKFLNLEN